MHMGYEIGTSLKLALKDAGLTDEEQIFLTEFFARAPSGLLEKMERSVSGADDQTEYLLALVYGVRIKRRLDLLSYLYEEEKGTLMKLVATLSGTDAKALYRDVLDGKLLENEDAGLLVSVLESDLNRILTVTRRCFNDLLENRSRVRDEAAERKILEKLNGT